MNVLVTTGTRSDYNFHRLLRIIDSLCEKKVIYAKNLVVQSTDQDYIPKNYKLCQMMSNNEFKSVMSKADIVISHAGTGTVITALKMNKKLILFPRLKDYGEHIDNHQLQICQLFLEKGYVMVAKSEEELEYAIYEASDHRFNHFESNTGMFIEQLDKIIKKLFCGSGK